MTLRERCLLELPGLLGGSWFPPSSVMRPGWPRRASTRKSDFLYFGVLEIHSQNNCKMLSKMELQRIPKCVKCGKHVKEIMKKTGLGNMHMKITKQVETQTLQSLIFVSTPTRNRSFHLSRFAQTLTQMVPKNIQN